MAWMAYGWRLLALAGIDKAKILNPNQIVKSVKARNRL
jgi:hypothetical protein